MEKQEISKIIDEIIAHMQKIKNLQKLIGASAISCCDDILIYDINNFVEYAKATKSNIEESGSVSEFGNHKIMFYYCGYWFVTFASPEEVQKIKEKVLPLTTATEPNHENE